MQQFLLPCSSKRKPRLWHQMMILLEVVVVVGRLVVRRCWSKLENFRETTTILSTLEKEDSSTVRPTATASRKWNFRNKLHIKNVLWFLCYYFGLVSEIRILFPRAYPVLLFKCQKNSSGRDWPDRPSLFRCFNLFLKRRLLWSKPFLSNTNFHILFLFWNTKILSCVMSWS